MKRSVDEELLEALEMAAELAEELHRGGVPDAAAAWTRIYRLKALLRDRLVIAERMLEVIERIAPGRYLRAVDLH